MRRLGLLVALTLLGVALAQPASAQVSTPSYGEGPGASGALPATSRQSAEDQSVVVARVLPKTGQGPADDESPSPWTVVAVAPMLAVVVFLAVLRLRRSGTAPRVPSTSSPPHSRG